MPNPMNKEHKQMSINDLPKVKRSYNSKSRAQNDIPKLKSYVRGFFVWARKSSMLSKTCDIPRDGMAVDNVS